jgi:glucose dehydrogenase
MKRLIFVCLAVCASAQTGAVQNAARSVEWPTYGAPSVDQYGGDRPGDNLFGSSLVAADASTGKYLPT